MQFAFSTPYLYTTLTFGGDKQYIDCVEQYWNNDTLSIKNDVNCSGIRICVKDGTTIERKVNEMLGQYKEVFNITTAPRNYNFYNRFKDGTCQVLVADEFQVAKNITGLFVADIGRLYNYATTTNLSAVKKEPAALVTRKDDVTWSDFVNWVVIGLLYSESKGYTREKTTTYPDDDYYYNVNEFGKEYIDMFLFTNMVVGHMGEIYDRHLEKYVPRETINTINNGTDGGLIFSIPFGYSINIGPKPRQNSTLQNITDRDILNCGVSFPTIFARKNVSNDSRIADTYSGFDVDFCRALSAAIFGDPNKVNYTDVSAGERFEALRNGTVDVLSRVTTITLHRDVMFTFSPPNFYDTLFFGGASE
jgi:ABC-type amino acid transport substrate-binding protein